MEREKNGLYLTSELYDFIDSKCQEFFKNSPHQVSVEDIIYTFLNPNMILNDWDEGPDNDPLWNYELNQHSAIVFIINTIELVKKEIKNLEKNHANIL